MAKNKKAQILAAVMCATTIVGFSPVITHAAENNIESNNGTSNVTAHDNGYVTVGGTRFEFNSTGGASVIINNSGTLAIKGTGSNAFQADTNGNVTATGYISANRLHTIAAGIGTVDTLTGNRLLSVKDSANTENFFVKTDGLIGSKDSNGNLVFQMKDGAITAQSLKVTNDIILADDTSLQGMANTIKGIDSNGNIPNIAGIRRDDSSFSASGQSSTTIENTLTVDGPSNTVSMKDNSNNQAVFEISKDEGNGQSTKTDVKAGYVSITNKNGNETFAVDSNGTIKAANGAFRVSDDGDIDTNNLNAQGNVTTAEGANLNAMNDTLSAYKKAGIVAGSVSEPDNGIALGQGSWVNAGSIAVGDNTWVFGKNSIAIGNDGSVGADRAVALGNNIRNVAYNSVALGYGSAASREDSVSVGSSGNERYITNVKDGIEDTDAATYGQVKPLEQKTQKISYDENADMTFVDSGFTTQSGTSSFAVADGMAAINVGSNTLGMTSEGTTFSNGNNGSTTINGGTISTEKLLINGVDMGTVAGTASDVADKVQHITHYSDGQGVDYTQVEGTAFYADGSMSTAKGEFAVYADGSVHTSQNIDTKSDVRILDENYNPIYSLRDIGKNTQKISYDENADMTFVDSSFTTQSGNANFTVANGMAAINVGSNTLGMTTEGTTFTNGDNGTTIINGGTITTDTITTDKLVVGGVDVGEIAGTTNKIADKVQGIERDEATGTTTIEDNTTISKDGITYKGENSLSTTIDGNGIAVGDKTFIKDGEISTDNINVGSINGKDVSDLASNADVAGLKDRVGTVETDVKGIKEDIGDVNTIDSEIKGDNIVSSINNEASIRRSEVARIDSSIEQLDGRVGSLEDRMGDVEDRIDKVGAMSAAIANLRTMGYDPEAPTEIAVGVGQYKSETGLALGVFHYPNEDFMLSASISTSGDEVMGGIGATWKIGRKSAQERAIDDEKSRELKAEEKAAEMKEAAQKAKVNAQRERHAQMLAEREAANK